MVLGFRDRARPGVWAIRFPREACGQGLGLFLGLLTLSPNWVAVYELNSRYYIGKSVLATMYIHYVNGNSI